MPAIKIPGSPYSFYFYSNERNEPAHVHVERDGMEAKFWIGPVRFAGNKGFARSELLKILTLVQKHEKSIDAAWKKHFKK